MISVGEPRTLATVRELYTSNGRLQFAGLAELFHHRHLWKASHELASHMLSCTSIERSTMFG
jgi:hypothetical protein